MDEKEIVKLLCEKHCQKHSQVFVRFNTTRIVDKKWTYYCGTDIDILEVTSDNKIIAYEVKGYKTYNKKYGPEQTALFEGLDQAFRYLILPFVMKKRPDGKFEMIFSGGIFDYVYLVHGRDNAEFQDYEEKVFDITPIGFIIVTPDRNFHKVHEAKQNPLRVKEAKEHFLKNLGELRGELIELKS